MIEPFALDNDSNERYFVRPNVSVLYAPAVNFGTAGVPSIQSEDQVKIIGSSWDTYSSQSTIYRASASYMWFGKQYNTWNEWHYPFQSDNPFPRYESYSEGIVKLSLLDPRNTIKEWLPGLELKKKMDYSIMLYIQ